jgi:predicted MFS family arabinose efflux permease
MIKEIKKNPMYWYILLLVVAITIGFQAWRTLLNNYAVDEVGINGLQMGVIQSIREIPGFLALLVVYLLLIFKEHRLAAFSTLLLGAGVMSAGFFPSFGGLIVTTLIMSIGFHYFETVNQSLTLQYFQEKQAPVMIGRIKSMGALTNIIVGAIIWIISPYMSLKMQFIAFGAVVIILALTAFSKNPVDKNLPIQHKKMILRKKYWLFYTLNFLSGARRQIFVVFAVFMLVEKYHFQVKEIAILFILNNIATYFISPLVAKAINKFGERAILTVEYSSLIILFLCYAFIEDKSVVAVLYVIDHIFFSASMAINTFFQKTADAKDIAPSMAVGFTINHISAVVIPVIGGALWMINWRIPFIGGAVIAVLSLVFSQMITIQRRKLQETLQ